MNIPFFSNPTGELGIRAFIISELYSIFIGIICMILYRLYFKNALERNESLEKSFLLIAPSITAIFWAIQYSLPLSLGLLGALSFVRFRTPVKKAEDIGFLLLVIALSLLSSVYRFYASGILLLFSLMVITVKSLIADRRIPMFKPGIHIAIFILIENLEMVEIDAQIRMALIKEFPVLQRKNIELCEASPAESAKSLRYSVYFGKEDETLIPRLISGLEKIDAVQRVEVFRGKVSF